MESDKGAQPHQSKGDQEQLTAPIVEPPEGSEREHQGNTHQRNADHCVPPASKKRFINSENAFEAVIALTAVVGMIFLGHQSCVLKESVDEARKATAASEKATNAATAATQAAQAQTEVLTEQVFKGERAWLVVKNVRIETPNELKVGSKLRLMWDTVNVGQTPAHNLRTNYAIWFGPRASDPPANIAKGYSEARVLGPTDKEEAPNAFGVWMDNKPGREISAREMEQLRRGEIFLNARITVGYSTVFKDVAGVTRVCAYYEGNRFSYCGLRGTHIE